MIQQYCLNFTIVLWLQLPTVIFLSYLFSTIFNIFKDTNL